MGRIGFSSWVTASYSYNHSGELTGMCQKYSTWPYFKILSPNLKIRQNNFGMKYDSNKIQDGGLANPLRKY